MFITEPAVRNAVMLIQIEGRRLALLASLRPLLDIWLVGWLVGWYGNVHGSPSGSDTLLRLKPAAVLELRLCSNPLGSAWLGNDWPW